MLHCGHQTHWTKRHNGNWDAADGDIPLHLHHSKEFGHPACVHLSRGLLPEHHVWCPLRIHAGDLPSTKPSDWIWDRQLLQQVGRLVCASCWYLWCFNKCEGSNLCIGWANSERVHGDDMFAYRDTREAVLVRKRQ